MGYDRTFARCSMYNKYNKMNACYLRVRAESCYRPNVFEVPLHHDTLLRYFTGSLFYDLKCNNERVMGRVQELGSMTGVEYVEVETAHGGAHLMAVERRLRSGPNQTDTEAAYYMLEGTIYQAPDLKTLLQSRMVGAVRVF